MPSRASFQAGALPRAGTASHPGRVDVELPQPLAQGVAVDAEAAGGLELVAAHVAQHAAQQRGLDDRLKPFVDRAVLFGGGEFLARRDAIARTL